QCALQLRDWVAKDAEGMPHQAGTVLYGVYRRDATQRNSVERSAHGLFGFIRAGSFFPFDPSSSLPVSMVSNRIDQEVSLRSLRLCTTVTIVSMRPMVQHIGQPFIR